jgi:ComF family protein
MKIISYLVDLFYPKLCLSCGRKLLETERVICTHCKVDLPRTNFHLKKDNPVEILFWGRCNVYSAAAYYRYLKGGNVQQLIHNFKYKGFQEIGVYIGEQYGRQLMESEYFKTVDYLIPVPLHPKKKLKRGFNQSEVFGKGLEKSMAAKLDTDNLHRLIHTSSQTKKSRWERYKNVSDIFGIHDAEKLRGKHVLIIDDVITTGSTIEACVQKLNEIEGIKISVAAMATAAH